MISGPRYELLIAQNSLIAPWLDCIEAQRPAMPVMVIGDNPADDDQSRRYFRNFVIGLTDRRFLDHLANTRPFVRGIELA